MPKFEHKKVKDLFTHHIIHFSEFDSEHADSNVGGLMMMNATNNKNIIPKPKAKQISEIDGQGRDQLCGFVLGKEITCLVYNLYAQTKGDTCNDAAQRTQRHPTLGAA